VSPPSGTKGNLVILGGKASKAAELNLATKFANDVNGVKGVSIRLWQKSRRTEESFMTRLSQMPV
jgi:hypothetical protein